MRNLRIGGILCALGYLGLVAYLVVILYAYHDAPGQDLLVDVAQTVGYGLAGFACWRWIAGSWRANLDLAVARGPARWMSAAAVLLTAIPSVSAYNKYEEHGLVLQHDHGIDPHYRLIMAGSLAMVLGLLMAAAGFWIASSARRAEYEPEHVETAVV